MLKESDGPRPRERSLTEMDAIKMQVLGMKQVLRQHGRFIINPRTDKWIIYWDMLMFISLFFTATVTPFEVALLPSIPLVSLPQYPRTFTLFVTNRLVDALFMVDMIFQFFLAFQESHERGGMWVISRTAITRNYIRSGWFFIDLLSVIPFDVLTRATPESAAQDLTLLRVVRFARLLRLVKLLRLLRASRILTRWQNHIGLSHAAVMFMRFGATTFFLVHFMACTWAYAGLNWESSPGVTLEWESTWLEYYGFVNGTSASDQAKDWSERVLVGPHRIYFISLYVAVCSMFGSVGSISPRNYLEYNVITIMMFIGSMVWAWVIGSLCGLLATLNPHAIAFQNLLDELNHFMRSNSFDSDHRVRLRDFFRQTKESTRVHSYDRLLLKMSAQLRGDTALFIGRATLEKIWYFWKGDCEPQFLALVALNLQSAVYEAREVVPTIDLTVVMRGVVARRLVMLTKGSVLGTDCVIPDHLSRLRPLEAAFSLSFCQTNAISRSALFRLVTLFPLASKSLHHAAAIYTLKSIFRQGFTQYKKEERRTGRTLDRRVKSLEIHEGALSYSTGSAVLAAFQGPGTMDSALNSVAGDLIQDRRNNRLQQLNHFRRPSMLMRSVTAATKQLGSGSSSASGSADTGADKGDPYLDDDAIGDEVELHRDIRRVRREEAALSGQVETLRTEMRTSISGLHSKIENVVGALVTLESAVRSITMSSQGGGDSEDKPPKAAPTRSAPPPTRTPSRPKVTLRRRKRDGVVTSLSPEHHHSTRVPVTAGRSEFTKNSFNASTSGGTNSDDGMSTARGQEAPRDVLRA